MTPKGCVPTGALLLMLALGSLSGCADAFQPKVRPSPPPPQIVEPEPAPTPPEEKPEPPAEPAVSESAAPVEPAPEPEQTAKVFPPENLAGISQEEAAVLFGRPGYITQEPPAEVWRYLGPDGCSLSLFFYLDVSNSAYRALTYQVEPQDHDPGLCIGSIYESHARDG